MGIRYQKRVNTGRGFGLNISKSGVSPSYRTKLGSIGPKGFSIRSGIPGLTYRSRVGKGKNDALTNLIIFILVGVAAVVLYNIILLIIWAIKEIYHLFLRQYYKYKMRNEQF